MSQKEN